MSLRFPALAVVGALTLAGCAAPTASEPARTPASVSAAPASTQTPTPGDADALLAQLGLTGKSAKQAVESLDRDARARPLPMRASVRADRLILSDGTTEASLPIEGEKGFYLSVAPFVTKTHECYFHSLATCQGELVDRPVKVTITDGAGAVLVDAETRTYTNGFVGFWLPRDISGTVTVASEGKTGSVPITTNVDSPTCLTTLRLS